MRNYLIVAALAGLAACGANEAPGEGDALAPAGVVGEQAALDPVAAEMVGTYEVTAEDGSVIRQTVAADGTYFETVDGAEIERGTWHQKGEQMCFDPAGDAIEQCYNGGLPGGDGSFDVETDGGTASVRRLGEADVAEPAGSGSAE